MRVLVVHPDPEAARRIADTIRDAGHEPVVVPDGERAIDRFIQEPADAMVVEIALPGRDGGTTVESIRWAPHGDEVQVVLISTRGPSPRLGHIGRRVGALATLAGPLNEAAIASLVAGMSPRSGPTFDDVTPLRQVDRSIGGTPMLDDDKEPGEDTHIETDNDLYSLWREGDDPVAEQEGLDVERRARVVDGTREVLEGDLSDTPFPRLLYRLAEMRATGALVVAAHRDARRTTTGETPKKVVHFRLGVPVYVQSNLVQECLGQVLARGGHITYETLEESVQRMRDGEGRQGAVLLAMGAIPAHQLRDSLEDQLRVKLFDLFAWHAGRFLFSDREPPPAEAVTLEMSLPQVVLEGIVHRLTPRRLLSVLSRDMERYVVPRPRRMARFRRIEMADEAKVMLHRLDGTKRLRELLGRAGDRPGAAAQLIYALHCVEAVEYRASALAMPRLKEEPPEDDDSLSLSALREELGLLCRQLRAGQYAEALGVGEDDPRAAQRATERLATKYRGVTESDAPREVRALAFEVCARLVHARRALTGAPQSGQSQQQSLARLAKDDRTRTERPSGMHVRGLQDRPTVPDPHAADWATASEWEGRPTDPGDYASLPEALEGAKDFDDLIARLDEADAFFARGSDALSGGRIQEALAAFDQAVRLSPNEADLVAHLGYARYLAAPEDEGSVSAALAELTRGTALAPRLPMPHLLLARVLRDRGAIAAARDAYEEALSADPDCGEALTALRELSGP